MSITTGLHEQRRNLALNPKVASATTDWNVYAGATGTAAGTRVATGGPTGGAFYRCTWSTAATGQGGVFYKPTSTGLPTISGQTYTVSAYVRSNVAKSYVPGIDWQTGTTATSSTTGAVVALSANTWTRVSVTAVATGDGAVPTFYSQTSSANGDILDVTQLLVEQATSMGTYFDGDTTDVGTGSTLGDVIYSWTGTANASASIQQITVTGVYALVEDTSPPRVRIEITDSGTPSYTSVTVMRTDSNGNTVPVRTYDGNPLALSTSGSSRVGFIYDYEAPFGLPVTYSTVEDPTATSASVTVDEDAVWLVHPGIPSLSQKVDLRAESLGEETFAVKQSVFYPMGRTNPVIQTDGTRKGAQSSLTVAVDTLDELAAIKTLVADAGILFLNVPVDWGWGIRSGYIAVQDVTNRRISDIGADPYRSIVMPFYVVDRPVGGSQSLRTMADLLSFASLATLRAAYPTLLALATGP